MRQRLISAAVLVPVVVIVFLVGDPWLSFGIAIVAALGAYESARLMRAAGLAADTAFVVPAAVILVIGARFFINVPYCFGCSGVSPALVGSAGLTVVFAIVVIGGLLALRHHDTRLGFLSWAGNVLGALYPGLLAALTGILIVAPLIPAGQPLSGKLDPGRIWLLILVLTVWSF